MNLNWESLGVRYEFLRENLDFSYGRLKKGTSSHSDSVLFGGAVTFSGESLLVSLGTDSPLLYAAPIIAGALAYGASRLAGIGLDKAEAYLKPA